MNPKTKKEVRKALVVTAMLFLTILSISLIQAITLQELLDSYSYDYYGEEVDIINVSDSLSGNVLSFNVTISNATAGSYTFYIDLEDGVGVVSGEAVKSISASGDEVSVNISTLLLSGQSVFNYT